MTWHFGWNPKYFGHIDHTKVVAPYIRVADANLCPNGTLSILYDFRLCQPNTSSLSSTILHSLEHCLLAILPDLLPGFLMVGPMGCRTGMYIVTSIPLHKNYVQEQLCKALQAIGDLKSVPYQSEKTCGMACDHNLVSVQETVHQLLNSSFFQNETTKVTNVEEII
ncbi:MAG: S-ribosylhomocysteine lyase [Gammaproteobacteria bacterium]|nr:MAG: S-ribosylhomocysteine lyase [Gammaproteobacteria bacterium]